MKRLIRIFVLIGVVVLSVNKVAAQKEIFLRRIDFKLDAVSDIDYENEYFLTMQFNKGENYLFKITNHIDNYAGEAVIQILDADKLVSTNVLNDKYFEKLSFICNKTGFYDILVRFKDKKVGNSMIEIKIVQ